MKVRFEGGPLDGQEIEAGEDAPSHIFRDAEGNPLPGTSSSLGADVILGRAPPGTGVYSRDRLSDRRECKGFIWVRSERPNPHGHLMPADEDGHDQEYGGEAQPASRRKGK